MQNAVESEHLCVETNVAVVRNGLRCTAGCLAGSLPTTCRQVMFIPRPVHIMVADPILLPLTNRENPPEVHF